MSDQNKMDDKVEIDALEADSLDDASRRALLGKLAKVSAAAVPVSVVMLDAKKAAAQDSGSSPGFGGF